MCNRVFTRWPSARADFCECSDVKADSGFQHHRHEVRRPSARTRRARPSVDRSLRCVSPLKNFPFTEGFLEVAFSNDASKAASEVDFGLVSRNSMIAVTNDVGTFSPGAKIDHEFSVDPQIFPIGTALPY